MTASVVIQGLAAPTATSSALLRGTQVPIDVESARTVRIEPGARGAAGAASNLGQWADDDLVELELDQGVRVWMSVADLRKSSRFNAAVQSGEILVSATARGIPGQRGFGDWVIKALTVCKLHKDAIGGTAHVALVEKIEDGLKTPPGLYVLGDDPSAPMTPFDKTGAATSADPYLLFLHGTASSTEGSFGGLWQANGGGAMAQLRQRYDSKRILALQHYTLSVDPIRNALVVADALPQGSTLHLVSHSRGGLVGELLARAGVTGGAPFSDAELELFDAAISGSPDEFPQWNDAPANLRKLRDLLAAKRFKVERFVRVACPALGTTLASGKLQEWCNIVMNVAGGIVSATGPAILGVVSDLLKGVIAKVIDFTDLPGLQAMDPRGPLVKLLNSGVVTTDADLAIIGGVTEGSGVWGRLKMLLVDAFFTGNNDLVVDTPSMSGGSARRGRALRFLLDSPDINHFEYFRNPTTAKHLLDGLGDGDRLGAGFSGIEVAHEMRRDGVRARGARAGLTNPPVVFVLPGIMGSDLDVKGQRVWVDRLQLILHGLGQLKVDNPDVQPIALDEDTYSDLVDFLANTHNVVTFPYDWRLPLEEAGRKLNDALRAELGRINPDLQPIRIVAHSMGGLVARAMMLREDSVWPELCKNPNARMLMLGTPNRGSHAITHLLLGEEQVLKMLALLNVSQSMSSLLDIIRRYRGALDMMPWPSDRDYFDPAVWKMLLGVVNAEHPTHPWPQADASDLQAAHDFSARLAQQQLDFSRIFYVAGQADETPIGIRVDGAPSDQRITFLGTAAGDGRVPWDTGILAGMSAWYVNAVHGDIPAHKPSYPGFLEILLTGKTDLLGRTRPSTRGVSDVFELRGAPVSYLPDGDSVRRAGIGGSASRKAAAPPARPKVPVRVTWGDLRYAAHVVMVGHYAGDTIVSAEATLDQRLGGELRRRQALGVYPGRIGTALVIGNPSPPLRGARDASAATATDSGAIVIGLGDVGELTSAMLSHAVAQGIAAWLAERTRNDRGTAGALEPAGLSLLLIGSGGAGLNVPAALSGSLRGIADALDLANDVVPNTAMLSEIEFIELFQDRAHSLWHELGTLTTSTDLKDAFVRKGVLRTTDGARRRVRIDEAPEWWQRLQILRQDDGALLFNDMVTRARSELRVLPTQRNLIDRLLDEATRATQRDQSLETTLFELLVPNELKDAAPRRDNLLLVLDADTARYPWELLTDPRDKNHLPQAVVAGALRQFTTKSFRENPTMVSDDSALVIGDPQGPFVELGGAQAEASAVATALAAGKYAVNSLIRPKTSAVIRALYAKPYRVVHFAGHGVADVAEVEKQRKDSEKKPDERPEKPEPCCKEKPKPVSGMVLEAGAYLTYAEVGQMRNVPELVFINCCHLGAIHGRPSEMAAQFGEKFIELGVRAVVAAGWAVDDAAASFFATEFYTQMLHGVAFGEAVKRARKACLDHDAYTNTWGAYQCYGDPDYRLVSHGESGGGDGSIDFASEDELMIDGIERAIAGYDPARNNAVAVAARLEQLGKAAPDLGFARSGRISQTLGRAYERLGDYAKAIECYDAALAADNGRPSEAMLGVAERRGNLITRQAIRSLGPAILGFSGAPISASARSGARRAIELAIKHLNILLQLGPTRERLVALGGAHKHLALVVAAAEQTAALKEMSVQYANAAKSIGNGSDPYPLLQSVIAEVLLEQRAGRRGKRKPGKGKAAAARGDGSGKIGALLAHADKLLAEHLASVPPDVWTDVAQTDLELAGRIRSGRLDDAATASIIGAYGEALTTARDSGAQNSIAENIGFIHALLKAGTGATANPLLERLERIYRAVTGQ